MHGVLELTGGDQLPDALEASFETDLVVIRNIINPSAAAHYAGKMPARTRQLNITSMQDCDITREIPNMQNARKVSRHLMRKHMGLRTLFLPRYQLQADLMRRGGIELHNDKFRVLGVVSINLTDSDHPVKFYAERVAHPSDPIDQFHRGFNELRKQYRRPAFCTDANPGDAVVLSRGVAHMVVAEPDRVAIQLASRVEFL